MKPSDLDQLTTIIQAGYKASAGRIAAFFRTGRTLVYDDGQVNGFCTLREPREDHAHQVAGVRIYTAPAWRKSGIGNALWEAMLPDIRRSPVELIDTIYRTDNDDVSGFFTHRGFERWFTNIALRFEGPRFPEQPIAWRQYEDRDFEAYLRLINAAFGPMRRDNDIEPYVIFSDELIADADLRKEFADNAGNLFVFLDGDQIMGLTEIGVEEDGTGFVEALAVAPTYQGRGLGRQIIRFAVNRLLDRGITVVHLSTQDRNAYARRLYTGAGFVSHQDLEEARLWLR